MDVELHPTLCPGLITVLQVFPQKATETKGQERRKKSYSNCGYHSTFTAKRQNNADAALLQLVPRVALRLVLEFLLEVLDKLGNIGFCISISRAVPGVASELGARS